MARTSAVELAPQVWRIPTAPSDLVNSFAFVDDDGSVTLVDAGMRQTVGRIVDGLAVMGKQPEDVQRLVLTHAHFDHAGGAAAIIGRSSAAGVNVHADDAPYARRGRSPLRDRSLTGWRALVARFPVNGGYPPVTVATELSDGDVLPVAGGLSVVHTPGHTPGHVSLLHRSSGVLITGDAIWNMRSRMTWPILAFCTDARLNQQTAEVLGELDYAVAAFTHGPEIRERARESVRGFLRSARRR